MIKILRPPMYDINLSPTDIVIFLAGPIQGSSEWHEEIIDKIKENNIDKNVIICSPKRLSNDNFIYDEQVNWESLYLDKASKQGIVIFWLAEEINKVDGRSYAQTTRFEIGEWWAKGQYIDNFKIIVGAENGFNGLKYITKKFTDSYKEFKLISNIGDMVDEIIKKLNGFNQFI